MTDDDVKRAMQGVTKAEQRLLALAAQRRLHGFKIEWNEDLDFGHLMDPVPVALVTEGGRVTGHFSLADLAQMTRADTPVVENEIGRLLDALAQVPHDGPPLHEPPGAP